MPSSRQDLQAQIEALKARREKLHSLSVARRRLAPVRRYWSDPVGFAHDCIDWGGSPGLVAYQQQILADLHHHGRESVRGPHGLGKTTVAAIAVLHFALTRDGEDWKVLTTASAWRQLEVYLWPEIHKWARRLRWDVIGRPPLRFTDELLMLNLKLATGQATALASDRAELLEGAHADHMLYVLDEAKAIPPATWDAVEGAFASGNCMALAISTPAEPQGRFYEIHSRKAGTENWHPTHVTLEAAVAAGRVDAPWAAQCAKLWGAGSAVYQNRVLGEFATSSSADTVIPLAWVEAANERWLAWKADGKAAPLTAVGVDVARGGGDRTVLALRQGAVISELRMPESADTMSTTGAVAGLLRGQGGYAVVDVIGIGAGVVDRLREQGLPVWPFNAAEGTPMLDSSGELAFINKRSAAWWGMRELLDPDHGAAIALPPCDPKTGDDLLTGDLTAPHWRVTSAGRIQVESKDDIRKRLGRSTDHGDAVVQAFWVEPAAPQTGLVTYEEDYRISSSPY